MENDIFTAAPDASVRADLERGFAAGAYSVERSGPGRRTLEALGAVARHPLSVDRTTITGEGAPKKERIEPDAFFYISQCATNIRAFQWNSNDLASYPWWLRHAKCPMRAPNWVRSRGVFLQGQRAVRPAQEGDFKSSIPGCCRVATIAVVASAFLHELSRRFADLTRRAEEREARSFIDLKRRA